jgi:aldose 1-epimerase
MRLIEIAAGELRATIAPEIGGALSELSLATPDASVALLRPATPAALRDRDPLGVGSFPLVPFSNRIENGRYDFAHQSYRFEPNLLPHPHPLHGHGWRRPWKVIEASARSAVLELDYQGDDWPSRYRARQVFELSPEGLTLRIAISNTGDRPMPAGIGLHPYFPRTPRVRLSARLPDVWLAREDKIPIRLERTPGAWDFSTGRSLDGVELDHCFSGWDGYARIDWPEHEIALEIESERVFGHVVIYVPGGADFFCFEPVSHANDALNLEARGVPGTGTVVLDPGAALAGKTEFRVLRGASATRAP